MPVRLIGLKQWSFFTIYIINRTVLLLGTIQLPDQCDSHRIVKGNCHSCWYMWTWECEYVNYYNWFWHIFKWFKTMDYANISTRGIAREWRPLDPKFNWDPVKAFRPWASCQIRKIAGAHAPGMPGTFSPSPQVSDPDMHHGTCVSHVPWCMPGSLTSGFLWNRRRGKTFPAFPVRAQPAILRIW